MTWKKLLAVIGAGLLSLSSMGTQPARADTGDVLLGAAVGAGLSSAIDDDDDGYYTTRNRGYRYYRDPYYNNYRSYRSWRSPAYVYDSPYYTRRYYTRRSFSTWDDDDDD